MKNQIKIYAFRALLVFGSLVSLTGCGSKENKEISADKVQEESRLLTSSVCTVDSEAVLSLQDHTLDPTAAGNERTAFTASVGTSSTTIDTRVDSIPYTEFCKLYDVAKQLSVTCTHDSIITGLKISMGLWSTLKKMKLIYEPMKLCLSSVQTLTSSTTNTYLATFSVTGTSISSSKYYYDQTSRKFSAISNTVASADTARYIQKIRIAHSPTTTARQSFSVNTTNDTLSDVLSVFYSFQEIQDLYTSNTPNPTYIKVWNSLRNYYYVSAGTNPVRKHSIFMGADWMDKGRQREKYIYAGDFSGKYANLAHLCPPNCSSFVFTLYH